jgi:hypothetical protein
MRNYNFIYTRTLLLLFIHYMYSHFFMKFMFFYALKSKENEECVVCSSIYAQMYIKDTIEIGEAITVTKFYLFFSFSFLFLPLFITSNEKKPVSQRQKLPDKKRIKF